MFTLKRFNGRKKEISNEGSTDVVHKMKKNKELKHLFENLS